MRILLIDDSPDDRAAFRRFLRNWPSVQIVEEESAEEGFVRLEEHDFDVVVVDQHLPRNNGLWFIEQVRGRDEYTMPIVMLTGSSYLGQSYDDIDQIALERGADDYLVKDEITAAGLRRALDNAMTKRRMWAALEAAHRQVIERASFEQRLLGIVSHDMRSPLGTIVIGLELLREICDDAKQQEIIGRVIRSTTRMTRLVEDLLDMTHARQGQFRVEREKLDLLPLVRTVAEETRTSRRSREIRTELREVPPVYGDHGRIEQLLVNLVNNALTHGAEDSAVDIRLFPEGETAVIEVENTGDTVPPTLQEKLFEPFVRGSSRPGTGLGLYIVKAIAKAHEATIALRSCDGVTTFRVTFPLTPPSPSSESA
ncbi:response regulator receiver sensor signal transduction histidine kinase [Haliangium ochraceum DSM 14365]|uniref:histidine kinase n=1 Tax=Haliangium ochraceum (strain DSM 14365 / JCM 11303 / SMP-2) TaxID=502025 RepID=D0LRI8_HALO1|nr:response regulator receiver sensor signal transduction histidine kinase [Haliangium ochraceum DSM 14365]